MSNEARLLEEENLPLDLGGLGMVIQAELVLPGVYDAVIKEDDVDLGIEAYIVLRSAAGISDAAKQYGREDLEHPGFLVYSEGESGNTRYIIYYELIRNKILQHIPLREDEDIRDTAAFGAEMYPGYFGGFPVPFQTPWGDTVRNKVIANGVFWLETERCQRGLAVAYPIYDDLSDGARGLAEVLDDESVCSGKNMPQYLFFREADSCVPAYELISGLQKEKLCCEIDRFALMNAIYLHHPEYAALHNLIEQAGQNASAELLLQLVEVEVKPSSSPERLISLSSQAGTEFILF